MKLIEGLAEGQVLQRLGRKGANVLISGMVSEAGPLFATISNSKGSLIGWKARRLGEVSGGCFSIQLSGIPAGGPYRLELCTRQGESARIKEFFVGDVWILAGQSNMEGYGNREGAAVPHALVRAFSMRRIWRKAIDPIHILSESPDACHREGAQCTPEVGEQLRKAATKGVGVGVYFGREMLERSGVPQGLICAAHGGTSMEQWSPQRKKLKGESLYASMLASVRATGQPVAGLLWYQGESDANVESAPHYTERMKRLVAATRRNLRQPRLPWIMVQLARVIERRPEQGVQAWNSIQEQQRQLPGWIKHLETVAAIDLLLDDQIHISSDSYPLLAARMARVADRLVLGNRRELRPPQLDKITLLPIKGTTSILEIRFKDVVGGLHSVGAPNGFSVLDKEGKNLVTIYKTTLHGNTVRIYRSPWGPRPHSVAYGHGLTPYCNIVDGRGFALPVFGPIPILKPTAFLPFVTTWKVSKVIPTSASLAKVHLVDIDAHRPVLRTYTEAPEGFVNEYPRWAGKSGHAYFSTQLRLPKPMRLEFLMGYDGPFRLWLNRKPLFQDLAGTNPSFPDESRKTISLAAGVHEIRIAMDLNNGAAWGFYLRFIRKDVTASQIKSGDYAVPDYLRCLPPLGATRGARVKSGK